jgi:hypothetical protein
MVYMALGDRRGVLCGLWESAEAGRGVAFIERDAVVELEEHAVRS